MHDDKLSGPVEVSLYMYMDYVVHVHVALAS